MVGKRQFRIGRSCSRGWVSSCDHVSIKRQFHEKPNFENAVDAFERRHLVGGTCLVYKLKRVPLNRINTDLIVAHEDSLQGWKKM